MSSEDILNQLKATYLAGIPAHLEEMEEYILAMEDGVQYQDNFEALYRKAHSLKGSGGTYGFSIITSICHQMEDYISATMQDGENVQKNAFDNIFKYIDILKDTQSLLLNNTDDFKDIENRLKLLKDNVLTQEINGLLVASSNNMYSQICKQVFEQANAHCTISESGLNALQRILHEHFDFVVTSRENPDLSGPALIAALKISQRKGDKLKTILTTSGTNEENCESIKPDYVILKNKSFGGNLAKAIEEIKNSI